MRHALALACAFLRWRPWAVVTKALGSGHHVAFLHATC